MSDFDPRAVEWIDRVNAGRGLSGGWRLQVLSKRYRKNATETCGHELPFRIRRFVPGCPWALVNDAIRYLISLAPYGSSHPASTGAPTSVVYNGLELTGSYRPTLTQWMRDEQSTVDEQKPQNGTYTLVQDLIEESECDDAESASTSLSCSESVETTWHWDDDAPGDIASKPCEQGVTWAVTQVNRKEDGTFDWALVKRVAKTQHSGPVQVECDCLSETTVETWDNLYGSASAGYRSVGSCEGADGAVSLPDPCTDPVGTKTQVQITENPDCTLKAVVTVRKSKAVDSERWTDGTACRPSETVVVRNSRKVPSVRTPGVGETVKATLRLNEDCTWNSETTVSSAPSALRLTWRDGNSCRPRTVTQITNSRTEPAGPDLSSYPVGTNVEFSKRRNDDCTWDSTLSVRPPADPVPVSYRTGTACTAVVEKSLRGSSEPLSVPVPSVGETVSANITRNDDCTYDSRYSVATSTPDSFSWSEGSACRPVAATHKLNQRSLSLPAVPAAGTLSANVSKNQDCTYDVQYKVTQPSKAETLSWTEGTQCQTRTVTSYQNAGTKPSVPKPAVGETVSASLRRTDECLYDGQVAVTTSVPDHMQWTEGSSCQTVNAHHLVNQKSYSIPAPGDGQHVSASVSRNPDCTYDVQYKIQNPYKGSAETWTDGPSCKKTTHTLYIDSKVKPVIPSGDGEVRASLSFNPNNCTWSGQISQTPLLQANESLDWEDGPECKRTHHEIYIDRKEKPSIDKSYEGEQRLSLSYNPNNCTWSGQLSQTPLYQAKESLGWDDGPSCRRRHHTLYIDNPDKPKIENASPGVTVEAHLSFNPSNCTWSGSKTVTDKPDPDTIAFFTGSSCNHVEEKTYLNQDTYSNLVPEPGDGEYITATVRKTQDCLYDVSYTKYTEELNSKQQISWVSLVKGRSTTEKYDHKVVLYRGWKTDSSLQAAIRSDFNNKNAVVSGFSYSTHTCTFSATASSSDLIDWWYNDSGSSEGGIVENESPGEAVYHGNEFIGIAETIAFSGTGNEGTESYWKTHGVLGVASLPSRTYIKRMKSWAPGRYAGTSDPSK